MYCPHFKECMDEGYKAMADERRLMTREELERRLEYCYPHDIGEILAEFDRLTEEIKKLEFVAESLVTGLKLVAKREGKVKPVAEALDRICELLMGIMGVKEFAERLPPTSPVRQSLLNICDYLDSQQEKPSQRWKCCGGLTELEKPKDEEVLRGILNVNVCLDKEYTERLLDAILKHFQLKEGE